MWLLTVIFWSVVLVGAAGVIVAIARPGVRRTGLWIAAGAFLVAGILGLASIGIFFLVGAVACGVAATQTASS